MTRTSQDDVGKLVRYISVQVLKYEASIKLKHILCLWRKRRLRLAGKLVEQERTCTLTDGLRAMQVQRRVLLTEIKVALVGAMRELSLRGVGIWKMVVRAKDDGFESLLKSNMNRGNVERKAGGSAWRRWKGSLWTNTL